MNEIILYDMVGPGDAEHVVNELPDGPVTVRINSPGGLVSEGLAIYNALTRHKFPVTVEIDGLAASIASFTAIAGSTVRIAETGLMMIHAPWVSADGNAEELRRMADALDANATALVNTYSRKTGKSAEAITDLMAAETWMTAEQAVEAGFADEIMEPLAIATSVRFDLSRYRNSPTEVFEMTKETKTEATVPKPPSVRALRLFARSSPPPRLSRA